MRKIVLIVIACIFLLAPTTEIHAKLTKKQKALIETVAGACISAMGIVYSSSMLGYGYGLVERTNLIKKIQKTYEDSIGEKFKEDLEKEIRTDYKISSNIASAFPISVCIMLLGSVLLIDGIRRLYNGEEEIEESPE